jgi:hypothetical protein
MKTNPKNVSASKMGPVEVTIAVKKFKDVLATSAARGGGTGYAMKLRKGHPLAVIKGNDIHVKGPGATLRFTIASSGGDKNQYYPIGIAFVREGDASSSHAQRLGHLNFPKNQTVIDGRTLLVTDTFKDDARNTRHEFSVVIQRGADGKIGIIDPGIVHENE